MCGIAGLWNITGEPVYKEQIHGMNQFLAHRGPDGEGTFIDGSVGLGHRRLAILDLTEAGHQPMSYGNGRYWITYNGEIFNFIELRDELESLGYSFRSDTDTEVILAAYLHWGEFCQLKFNGMWAFAVWDKAERALFLSRDRFAIKPLYYIYDGQHFAFASEMKAFLALEWFDAVFDNASVASELARMNDFEGTEHCLLHGVRRLNAGHCLTVCHSEVPMLKRWWNTLEHLDSVPKGFDQQVEKFQTLFFDACRIRMRSDVAIGTALSGGLDSSSVLCAMNHMQRAGCEHQRLAADWQHAFVATFPGTVQDERQYAEEVVRATGVNSTYARMSVADAITYLDDALFDFEEIGLLPTPVWSLYRQMRASNIVVSLDGHGADEMLVGYYWYPEIGMREALAEYLRTYPSVISDAALERVRNLEQVVVGLGLEELGLPVPRAQEILDELSGKMRGPKKTTGSPSSGWLIQKPRTVSFPDYRQDVNMMPGFDGIDKRMYLDFHYRTLPTILRNFDRCSMSNGVEVRAPFMDWRLVCYVFALSTDVKIRDGFTKYILREAMKGLLPESIRVRRNKLGFVTPLMDWVQGSMKPFILDAVNSSDFLQSDVWNGPVIRDCVERAYMKNDFKVVTRAWDYIQAMRIMQLFKERSRTCLMLPKSELATGGRIYCGIS